MKDRIKSFVGWMLFGLMMQAIVCLVLVAAYLFSLWWCPLICPDPPAPAVSGEDDCIPDTVFCFEWVDSTDSPLDCVIKKYTYLRLSSTRPDTVYDTVGVFADRVVSTPLLQYNADSTEVTHEILWSYDLYRMPPGRWVVVDSLGYVQMTGWHIYGKYQFYYIGERPDSVFIPSFGEEITREQDTVYLDTLYLYADSFTVIRYRDASLDPCGVWVQVQPAWLLGEGRDSIRVDRSIGHYTTQGFLWHDEVPPPDSVFVPK